MEAISDQEKCNTLANHIVQSFVWGEFRSKTGTVKKVARLVSDDKKLFQIFFHKIPHLPYTIAYLPRSLFPSSEELVELKRICAKEKAIFLKVEPSSLTTDYRLQTTVIPAESVLPQHTIHIDLTQSEEQLLSQMHEKTRYNVRLAIKRGVEVKMENTPEGLEKFIEVLEATEKRQGFYSHNPDYYRLLFKVLEPAKMVYILNAYIPATNSQKPIASVMLFRFKDFLYYPYGGSHHEFRQYMTPQLLHWEAIVLGKRMGCKVYDLWGSYKNTPTESDPWWGFYRLKKGFGGKPVDFPPTVDIPLSPLYSLFVLINKLRWLLLKIKR
jgi:lipid II:glycine glycyltransferase (peptidoglycan interpeptide bridge formation enzyme)